MTKREGKTGDEVIRGNADRQEGRSPDEVVEDIVEGMASAYDPEPEEKPKKSKAVADRANRKAAEKLPKTRSLPEWRKDFWDRREVDKHHDIVRAHVLDMLDLAGWEVKGGKDALEFRRELRELIEKRFVKKETK